MNNNIKWVYSRRGADMILLLLKLAIAVVITVGKVYIGIIPAVENRKQTGAERFTVIGNGGKSSQFVGGGTKEW